MSKRDELDRLFREEAFATLHREACALADKAEHLEKWRDGLPDLIRDMRAIRGKTCKPCAGFGVRTYGSTATWHGGAGGQSLTPDVCDKCWGSGDADFPWPNRKYPGAAQVLGEET